MALVKYNNNSISAITTAGTMSASKVLIKEINSNNASTTSFVHGSSDVVLDSTYPIYIIDLINIHNDTSDKYLQFNFSSDSGSNYNVAKTSTAFNSAHKEDNSYTVLQYETSMDLANGTGSQRLTAGQHNASDTGHSGRMIFFNLSSTTFVKHFLTEISTTGYDGSNEYNYHTFIGGYANTTSAINGIQFSINSGTHDGKFKLYGIKDS
jgi:hypothetical protein